MIQVLLTRPGVELATCWSRVFALQQPLHYQATSDRGRIKSRGT